MLIVSVCMNEIVLIGGVTENAISGPSIVINNIYNNLKKTANVTPLFYVNGTSKLKFFFKMIHFFWGKRDLIVNVHSSGISLPYFVYLLSKIFKKNKYFLSLHGLYYKEITTKGKAKKSTLKKEKKYIRNFPNIICVSELLKERIMLDYGRTESVFVVENGIETGKLLKYRKDISQNKQNGEIKFIMIGGIRVIKGVWECIDLVKYLLNENINVRLDIYGNVENDELYQILLEKTQSVKEYVSYKGIVCDKDDLYSIMSKYDFQLCLSQWDTFNVAVIESLGLGLPCIASDMCGASSFIKEKTQGIAVDIKDENYMLKIEKYIREYYKIIEDSPKFQSDLLNYFSWENITLKYLKTVGIEK